MSSQTQAFEVAKGIIARKNQNGTVILMKTDESSLFYKIDGVAALVWIELEQAKNVDSLVNHFTAIYPNHANELNKDIPRFVSELLKQQLVSAANNAATSERAQPKASATSYYFGGIQEFNLEQIETEVLSEGVYLDVFAGSDLRLKQNIAPIQNALTKISQLEGVTFEWNDSQLPPSWLKATSGPQAGLIAQEVASVMPELVRSDRDTGFLAMDYSKLTSYLVEGIKELSELAQRQEKRIAALEAQLGSSRLDS